MLLHKKSFTVGAYLSFFSYMQAEDRALYNVDRKDASEFLGVSERTIDRYVRAGKLLCRKVGHHVYLSKEELLQLKNTQDEAPVRVAEEDTTVVEHTPRVEEAPLDLSVPEAHTSVENAVYRHLYEETRQELDKKQREVEALHYRLGQMEYEMKNTVPLLEYSKQKEHLEVENKVLQEEAQFVRTTLEKQEQLLHVERRIKSVYLVLVVIFFLVITLGVLFYVGVYNGTIRIV